MKEVLKILDEPLVIFLIWLAVIYLIFSVFFIRSISFIFALGLTTYLWIKLNMPFEVLKQVYIAFFGIIFFLWLLKVLSNKSPINFFTGKKLCDTCYMEIPRKAKVCPYCHREFSKDSNS